MILYLDSSAIVKQYVLELGSPEVQDATARSAVNGTAVVSRAEVTAAFRKGVRAGALREQDAKVLKRDFDRAWPNLVRTRITERLARYAANVAWTYGLRGYDSIHLASAVALQQSLGQAVNLATFDRALWTAARSVGLDPFPPDLPTLLERWRAKRSYFSRFTS